MTNKVYILTAFLLLGIIGSSVAQRSAQATMRVSVTVVKAASVETKTPAKLNLASKSPVELGSIELKGIRSDEALIRTNKQLKLQDNKGNQVDLDIDSRIKQSGSSVSRMAIWGSSSQKIKSGSYNGELSTTIEYL